MFGFWILDFGGKWACALNCFSLLFQDLNVSHCSGTRVEELTGIDWKCSFYKL